MNRTHRLHGGARLKLRIILPVNQIFTTCLLQNMPFIQSYKKICYLGFDHCRVQRQSNNFAVSFIPNILKQVSNMEENTSQLSSAPH